MNRQAALLRLWDAWPVGTRVEVTRADGTRFRTRTRSVPWRTGRRKALVVEGIVGPVPLDRVRKLS